MVKLTQTWNTVNNRSIGASAAAGLELTDADFDIEELDASDPDLPAHVREKIEQKKRDQKSELEFQVRQRQTDRGKTADAAEDSDRRLRNWLASDQYRLAYQQLCDGIDDTRMAANAAYSRSRERERIAQEALDDARRHALSVSGNRVYFSRDSKHLYAEDGSEITDQNAFGEAQRQHRANPRATSYEDFIERQKARDQAAREAELVRDGLADIERLDERVRRGNLSPEELSDARRERDRIIGNLPDEARQELERIQAIRQGKQELAYRAPDPAFASAPDLQADFRAAQTAPQALNPLPASAEATPDVSHVPAYRDAPDF